jgi:hypothetical protein
MWNHKGTLGTNAVVLRDSFRHVYELFSVDLEIGIGAFVKWDIDGDMKDYLKSLPWILATFGTMGRKKLASVIINFIEQWLRFEVDCPHFITVISENVKHLTGFLIECFNGAISSCFKHRKRSDMSPEAIFKESCLVPFYGGLRARVRGLLNLPTSGNAPTELHQRWTNCSGEKYKAEREAATAAILQVYEWVLDGDLQFTHQNRLAYFTQKIGATGLSLFESALDRSRRLYSGQSRVSRMKVEEVKKLHQEYKLTEPPVLAGKRQVLKEQYVQAIGDHMYEMKKLAARKDIEDSKRADEEVQNFTRARLQRDVMDFI